MGTLLSRIVSPPDEVVNVRSDPSTRASSLTTFSLQKVSFVLREAEQSALMVQTVRSLWYSEQHTLPASLRGAEKLHWWMSQEKLSRQRTGKEESAF